MDDNRSEFQRMIERACDDDHLSSSYTASVAFSGMPSALKCISASSPHGVRLVSITQELGDHSVATRLHPSEGRETHVRPHLCARAARGKLPYGRGVLFGRPTERRRTSAASPATRR
jgi:hypothetical protein